MVDPFSIATGAIALAGTGIKTAKALTNFIHTVRKAEGSLKPIIREIEVLSSVLTQISTILNNGEISKSCTSQLFVRLLSLTYT